MVCILNLFRTSIIHLFGKFVNTCLQSFRKIMKIKNAEKINFLHFGVFYKSFRMSINSSIERASSNFTLLNTIKYR